MIHRLLHGHRFRRLMLVVLSEEHPLVMCRTCLLEAYGRDARNGR